MLKYLRWFSLPFSWVYGLVTAIRNWCYDSGIFKSQLFNVSVISVGNLDVGGAGKSPMTEYLVRLLMPNYKPATLSRGYGRQTKGFVLGDASMGATELGDEPAQFKHKFPNVTVAVCEKRVVGIERLKADHDLIILDDAYQHRAVKPGLSILLFDFNRVFEPHFLLPAGNLREPFRGRERADIIAISKCPETLSQNQEEDIKARIKPFSGQQLFFTRIVYLPLQDMEGKPNQAILDADTTVFLITGIANAQPLLAHLNQLVKQVIHHNYADHHPYTLKNIAKLVGDFNACAAAKKVVVTTEKDARRLLVQPLQQAVKQLGILVLPIGVEFLNNGGQKFDLMIQNYVREHTTHN